MKLSCVSKVQLGFTHRGRLDPAASGGLLGIKLRDFSRDGGLDPDDLERYSLEDIPVRYLVGEGDVLFRSRGDRNTAVALGGRFAEPAVALSPLMVLRPNRGIVLPEFVAWLINQEPAQRHFDQTARGTSLRMVPKSSLDTLVVDIPDMETQRTIVAINALAERERMLSERLVESRHLLMRKILVDCARNASAGQGGANPT